MLLSSLLDRIRTRQKTGQRRRANNVQTETLEDRRLLTADFELQLLHASDLEGGIDALERAANFGAIVDTLEADAAAMSIPSLLISAGDNYIPGPVFSAAGNFDLRDDFQAAYQTLFAEAGLTNIREGDGRLDITIMNLLGVDASAVGNHEFDAGPDTFGGLIGTDIRGATLGDVRWLGAQFPYLTANLDFSAEDSLSDLFTTDVLPNTDFQSLPSNLTAAADAPKIAPATTIERDGELIGVVGATTQILESITSTGDVSVVGPTTNDMAALAGILQPVIDGLTADGVDKIILTSHLQQISLEQTLIGLLNDVDIVIAGGSDTLLADANDELLAGDTADATYPLVTSNADSDPALIVSTAGEYSYVGRLVVGFDANGVLMTSTLDDTVNGVYKTDDDGLLDTTGEATVN